MNNKTDLRRRAKELRKNLPISEISDKLTDLIRSSTNYISAKNVMLFYPTKYEIDLRKLLKDYKNFYLPRVNGKDLEVCPYKIGDKLEKSEFHIFEPISKAVDKNILDLIIVPALMVDDKGYRLGYGGGFYDRFLKDFKVKTISALPIELRTQNLPHEDFDISIDEIISA